MKMIMLMMEHTDIPYPRGLSGFQKRIRYSDDETRSFPQLRLTTHGAFDYIYDLLYNR